MRLKLHWKSAETRDEDGDDVSGCIIGSVQRVVLGVMLMTKARGECYRLSRYLSENIFMSLSQVSRAVAA